MKLSVWHVNLWKEHLSLCSCRWTVSSFCCFTPTRPSIPPAPLYLRTLWRYTNAVIIIISKWGPASAGKEKAGMVTSISGWTRGVQVKLSNPLRKPSIPEHLRGVFTTRRYTIQIHVYLYYCYYYYCYVVCSQSLHLC